MAGKSLDKLKDEFKEKMLAKKKGTGGFVELKVSKEDLDNAEGVANDIDNEVLAQLHKEEDAVFTKMVLDQLDKKKPKLLSGSDDPPKIGTSAIETAYKEIKEYASRSTQPPH
jgi:hypothetical protein